MLRTLALAALAVLVFAQAVAEEARVPVRVYLIAPADRPDPVTMLTATKQVTHEVKHIASTWGGQIFGYLNVGPDCQPTDVAVTVVKPPDHGRLSLIQLAVPPYDRMKAAFPKGDPRAECPRVPMRSGSYAPDPTFLGRDHMIVSFQEGDASFVDNIEVDVRRAERPNPLIAGR
jgi:hypothetical protein